MPELPEVETIRLGLQEKIVGLKITDVEIRTPKIFQGEKKEIIGAQVKGIRRRAKILILDLDNDKSLVIHLKLTGQLIFHKNGTSAVFSLPAKTTHLIFILSGSSKLYYNDIRKFGYIKVVETEEVEKLKALAKFGPEPFTPQFTLKRFKEILSKKKVSIKLLLMDQKQIAGVGNIYANEALFLARLNPQRKANTLTEEERERLYQAILEVLKKGIKYGGSSVDTYVNVSGGKGKMQEYFRVYGREGKLCPKSCGETIKRITLGGRGTFFCPACQK